MGDTRGGTYYEQLGIFTRDLNANILASRDHITKGNRFSQLTYRSSPPPPSNSISKRKNWRDLNKFIKSELKKLNISNIQFFLTFYYLSNILSLFAEDLISICLELDQYLTTRC